MDQPQHHACLTQCLLVDCSAQINYRALNACETPHFFHNTIWGWRSSCMCVRNRSIQTGHVREGKEKTEHRITPSPPPLVFVTYMGLCAFLLVCEWEKQCCPAQTAHHTRGGAEKSAWKEEGWVVFTSLTSLCVPFPQTVCGKTLWGTQTHHSFVLRHYNTPAAEGRHRRLEKRGVGWEVGGWDRLNRGTFQNEEGWRWRKALKKRCGLTHSLHNTNDTAAPPKSNKGPKLYGQEKTRTEINVIDRYLQDCFSNHPKNH